MLHQIGAGTLGPVYRGHDTQRERLVAVKLFKLDMPPELVHQLVAGLERIVSANLTHVSIATPVAAGLTGVSAYLACDYVAADSLDLAVREFGALPPADALQVAVRLAGALDHAVAAGFTHGCLHPRDVLMSARETRLTGIGVGQLLAELGVAPPVRRPYSAPERQGGSAWDRRADIFSLAALVHELLWGRRISGTGVKAVEGLTPLAGGDLDALKRVFKRALADDPMERHPTAKIFVDALKRALPEVAAEAPGFNLPPLPEPAPPARNLRLAMPTRPVNEELEPPLPLELPRFTEVEDARDLPITVAGPSIIGPTPDSVDAKPEDETQSALDRFALGWLADEPDPPKAETPFELSSFFETDRNVVPDISLKPIVIPDLTATDESAMSPDAAVEPTLVLRAPHPEPELVITHTPEPAPEPANVPEAVSAPAAEPALAVESAPAAKPVPEFKPPPAVKPASVGERNREIRPVREVKPAPPVEPPLEIKPAHEVEPAPEVVRAHEPARAPEPPLPAPEPPRRMMRSGPRSKSTNPLIGDALPVPAAAPVMADAPIAARSGISSRDETVVLRRDEPAVPKQEVVEEAAEGLPPPPSDLTMLDRSRSAVWPLVLALAVGVTLGFAGGYAVAVRSQPAPVADTTASAAPVSPATPLREFTEAAVPAAPPPAAAPVAAPPGAAPTASKPVEPAAPPPEPAAVRPPDPPAAPRKADAPAAAPTPQIWTGGRLNIRSTPPGATVSVDGRDVGETPTAVRDLKQGPLRIRIRRDGYTVHDRRVVITRARPVQMVNATLARQTTPAGRGAPTTDRSPAPPAPAATGSGTLSVESRPPGANVVLDGKVIGTTPLMTQSVPAGLHAIRLELDGYRIWAGSVRVAANEPARVRASLER